MRTVLAARGGRYSLELLEIGTVAAITDGVTRILGADVVIAHHRAFGFVSAKALRFNAGAGSRRGPAPSLGAPARHAKRCDP